MKRNDREFRILFFTQDDPFYVLRFFEEFFRAYPGREEIQGVVICEAMGKKSLRKLLGQMYAFYGPVDFARMSARYGVRKVLASLNAPAGNGRAYNLGQLCRRHGIPAIAGGDINAPEFVARVEGLAPDLIVSVAAPVIFRKGLIGAARLGCINIHNGRLPRYRGMLPSFWQLYHGENRLSITIHEINEEIDDGRIILQRDLEVLPGETLDSLMGRAKRVGARHMIEAIAMLRSGTVRYTENPVAEGSYFSFPTREDVREFRRRGWRLV